MNQIQILGAIIFSTILFITYLSKFFNANSAISNFSSLNSANIKLNALENAINRHFEESENGENEKNFDQDRQDLIKLKELAEKFNDHLEKDFEMHERMVENQVRLAEAIKKISEQNVDLVTFQSEPVRPVKIDSPSIHASSQPMMMNLQPGPPLHPAPKCGQKSFGTKFPPTLIHSFMGAGNTWLRHLIETATGFYTGSAFKDKNLYNGGFKGEYKDPKSAYNTVIGIKTHNPADAVGEKQAFDLIRNSKEISKCVILVRNPFNTFLAEFNRMSTKSHSAGVSEKNFESFARNFKNSNEVNSWMGLVGKRGKRWVYSYKTAFEVCNRKSSDSSSGSEKSENHSALIVFYENLKENTVQELKRIAIYLQQYDENRFKECVVESEEFLEGKFHRKKHVSSDPFSERQKSATIESVKILNETMGNLPESYLFLE